MPNVDDSNESTNSLSDDQHEHSHNTESWSSWMIRKQNTFQSETTPQDRLCQENDSPSHVIQSSGYSLPSVSTDNSLELSVGLLAITDSSQDCNSESVDGMHERHSQTLLLVDSVNTSDDVKSSSTTFAPYCGAVLRSSGGAVLKKFNDSSTSKGSKGCPSQDKNLKMKASSSNSSKDALVSDEDISPHSLAPPPPPPTPNVVLADGQEHKFIMSDSASEGHSMASHHSGHLNSWPVAMSLPCSVKRTSALHGAAANPETLQMHAIPNSITHHCSEFEIDEDSTETIPDSPSRHPMYGMPDRSNIFEDTVLSSPVGTTLTKELAIVKHTYVNSRFNNMACGSGGASSTFAPSPSCSHAGPVLSVSHSSVSAVLPASLDSSSNVCSTATARIATSSGLSAHQNQCVYTTSSSTAASASSVYTLSVVAPVLHLSSSVASTSSTGAVGGAVGSCPCGHIAVLPTSGSLTASVGISVRPTPSNGDRQSNTQPGGTDGGGPVVGGGAGEAGPAHHQRPLPAHNVKAGPMYNWQAMLTTVKERFAFLFNNDILSDVQFVVGRGDEEQNVPAHKFVLAVGSAVFDAMFNGQLASQQQVIHLPDVEPQAFLALLSFLYSDEVQIGPETVMTVLYTAKKYAVPALERRCVDFLQTNLSSDNAFMLLTQARLFDEPQLAALCLKTIDKCTAEAIVAEGFTDIDHDTLVLVLQRDTLRIKELHLYQAVCRWAEAECHRQGCGVSGRQQRAVLGQALQLIRFPLMTVEEFAQGPAQSGILTDAEVVQLFLYFSVNPKPSVDFIDVPRCCMTGKEQTMCRFQNIEARWGYSGTPDRIRFIVDRRIFVVGFGMYGSIHGPSEYEVTVQLIHTHTGKVCGSNETVFTSDGTVNTFRVMFPDPIEVLPNTNYTAYATLKGPDSHYGTKGLRKVIVECPSGDRVCFQFSFAAGNNNGTSVEDGQIPEIIFYT